MARAISSLNASMLTTAVFELGQQFMLQKFVMKPMESALTLISISRQNKSIVSDKVKYRGAQS